MPVDQGEAPEEAASRWREGVLEDAGASSSFAGVFNLGARSRYMSAPPVATVRQIWSPAAAQVIPQSVCLRLVCHSLYLVLLLNLTLRLAGQKILILTAVFPECLHPQQVSLCCLATSACAMSYYCNVISGPMLPHQLELPRMPASCKPANARIKGSVY